MPNPGSGVSSRGLPDFPKFQSEALLGPRTDGKPELLGDGAIRSPDGVNSATEVTPKLQFSRSVLTLDERSYGGERRCPPARLVLEVNGKRYEYTPPTRFNDSERGVSGEEYRVALLVSGNSDVKVIRRRDESVCAEYRIRLTGEEERSLKSETKTARAAAPLVPDRVLPFQRGESNATLQLKSSNSELVFIERAPQWVRNSALILEVNGVRQEFDSSGMENGDAGQSTMRCFRLALPEFSRGFVKVLGRKTGEELGSFELKAQARQPGTPCG